MRLPPREAVLEATLASCLMLWWVITEGQRHDLVAEGDPWTPFWLACLVLAGCCAWRLR